MLKVGVVGLGYVGLSSASFFAQRVNVVGLDIDRSRVESLRKGSTVISEEGLPGLLRSAVHSGRLKFTSDYGDLHGGKILFLTVGTPSLETGAMDTRQVEAATRSLSPTIRSSNNFPVVVVKSTVLPGTTKNLVAKTLENLTGKKLGVDFGVCTNPEFLREGAAVRDTLNPDRIVIGSEDPRSRRALRSFYGRIYGAKAPPMIDTNFETAELVKYACNAFLATKISFINLIARVCEGLEGSDVDAVAKIMGLDQRIGERFLEAGPGFGGSCFPKDVRAFVDYLERAGQDASMPKAVEWINETQPEHLISLAERNIGSLEGKTVALLGCAFKEGTDDVRESRGVKMAESLVRNGAKVRVYDPRALDNVRRVLGEKVEYAGSALGCIKGADLAIVVNAEPEFTQLRTTEFKTMKSPTVLDARRRLRARGLGKVEIISVGRGPKAG